MAPTIKASGNPTLVVSTPETLLDTSDAGVYQLIADIDNVADGDQLELRVYTKAKSGESYKVIQFVTVDHDRGTDGALIVTPALIFPLGVKYEALQTAGTGRTIVWSVVQP